MNNFLTGLEAMPMGAWAFIILFTMATAAFIGWRTSHARQTPPPSGDQRDLMP